MKKATAKQHINVKGVQIKKGDEFFLSEIRGWGYAPKGYGFRLQRDQSHQSVVVTANMHPDALGKYFEIR